MFREGNENYKMKSHGRAKKNEDNSRENSRDQEFSLVSAMSLAHFMYSNQHLPVATHSHVNPLQSFISQLLPPYLIQLVSQIHSGRNKTQI